jgi:CheY-like chemotaxis protein
MSEKIKAAVIDDVVFCRTFLNDLLEDRGYEVATFSNAEAFIRHCRADERCPASEPCVDLLLTDNQMPSMSGLEMIQKQVGKGCKVQAQCRAVISGSWSDEEMSKAKSFGCTIFEKPSLSGLGNWLNKFEIGRLTSRIG